MNDEQISNGGPAFPGQWYDFQPCTGEQVVREQWGGMSLRTYAAIHLGVPQSEHEWLNDMIRESQRNELAKAAMQGWAANEATKGPHSMQSSDAGYMFAKQCLHMADAMLAEQEKK